MIFIDNPNRSDYEKIVKRPVLDLSKIRKVVKPILKEVRKNGDKALIHFTEQFDGVRIDDLVVSAETLADAEFEISDKLRRAIDTAYDNIKIFHEAQIDQGIEVETMPGVICRRKSVPITHVGLYIPGGTAPLFSTVLMLGVPANIAGCKEIVLCTPPNKKGKIHPAILYAAHKCGITKVINCGGAQAIAAMAYGTDSVPAVYKIFGPGNQYVTAAKQLISLEGVAIDLPAGPSEVAIYASDEANASFVASDLLSQAEHGIDSQVLLISRSVEFTKSVNKEVEKQLKSLPRKKIAREALKNSFSVVVKSEDAAIDLLNYYATEHLILATNNAASMAEKIENAGSIFLGHYTPESAGDYASGTNHTLPTNRAALAYSGVSLDSFIKKITLQEISEEGLYLLGPTVEIMAAAEELEAHKNAVTLRLEEIKKKNGIK